MTTWTRDLTQNGVFKRKTSAFRNFIGASTDFPAMSGRYHLYVSLACPWAHRTLIVRQLKGLEKCLNFTTVDWFLDQEGWSFSQRADCALEPFYNFTHLRQLYLKANPQYDGRWTVPVLWDQQHETIVNNESSEIIRMLNSEFNQFSATEEQARLDLYPSHLRAKIDEVNSWIYDTINNGVYMCGFATTQAAYDEAFVALAASLDRVDVILSNSRYLTGDTITEADIRLFTTLIRFDAVYFGHFKCNHQMIKNYPNLSGYLRELYALPAFKSTTNFAHIKQHYYQSHTNINPTGIVPGGPALDHLEQPHQRDHLTSAGFYYSPSL